MRNVFFVLAIFISVLAHAMTSSASPDALAATSSQPADSDAGMDADDEAAPMFWCELKCRDRMVQCAELCVDAGQPPTGHCTCACQNQFCGCMASCGIKACLPKLCPVQ